MSTLIRLDFQGEPEVAGPLSAAEADAVRREAFPYSPAPSALGDPDWRGYKLAPLPSGRVLLSVAFDRGATDRFRRPVLSALALVVEVAELAGPLRDPVAAWRALEHLGDGDDLAHLGDLLPWCSALTSDEHHQRLVRHHARDGAFFARAAATLAAASHSSIELRVPPGTTAASALRPVLLLLPRVRLARLHLATGSEPSDHREPLQGSAEPLPAEPPRPRAPGPQGFLGSLMRRERTEEPPTRLDLAARRLSGASEPGPQWLSELITQPGEWAGLSARDALALALDCIDEVAEGRGDGDPFRRSAELARLRRIVHEGELIARGAQRWP